MQEFELKFSRNTKAKISCQVKSVNNIQTWCLSVDLVGDSYKSCSAITNNFQRLLPPRNQWDAKIETNYSLAQQHYDCVDAEYSILILMALLRLNFYKMHDFFGQLDDEFNPLIEIPDDYNRLIIFIQNEFNKIVYPGVHLKTEYDGFIKIINSSRMLLVKDIDFICNLINKHKADAKNELAKVFTDLEAKLLNLREFAYISTWQVRIKLGKILQEAYVAFAQNSHIFIDHQLAALQCLKLFKKIIPARDYFYLEGYQIISNLSPANLCYKMAEVLPGDLRAIAWLQTAAALDDGVGLYHVMLTCSYSSFESRIKNSFYLFYLTVKTAKEKGFNEPFKFESLGGILEAYSKVEICEDLLIATLKLFAEIPDSKKIFSNLSPFLNKPTIALAILNLPSLWKVSFADENINLLSNLATISEMIGNATQLVVDGAARSIFVTSEFSALLEAADYHMRGCLSRPNCNRYQVGEGIKQSALILNLISKQARQGVVGYQLLRAKIYLGQHVSFLYKLNINKGKKIIFDLYKQKKVDQHSVLLSVCDTSIRNEIIFELGKYFLNDAKPRDTTAALYYFTLIESTHPLYQQARFECANINLCLQGNKEAALTDFVLCANVNKLKEIKTPETEKNPEPVKPPIYIDDEKKLEVHDHGFDTLIYTCLNKNPATATFAKLNKRKMDFFSKQTNKKIKNIASFNFDGIIVENNENTRNALLGTGSEDQCDSEGNTILHRAVLTHDKALIRDIIATCNIDIFHKNKAKLTAIDLLESENLLPENALVDKILEERGNLRRLANSENASNLFQVVKIELLERLAALDGLIAYGFLSANVEVLAQYQEIIFKDSKLKDFAYNLGLKNETNFGIDLAVNSERECLNH